VIFDLGFMRGSVRVRRGASIAEGENRESSAGVSAGIRRAQMSIGIPIATGAERQINVGIFALQSVGDGRPQGVIARKMPAGTPALLEALAARFVC
jgi:hypothetical protein